MNMLFLFDEKLIAESQWTYHGLQRAVAQLVQARRRTQPAGQCLSQLDWLCCPHGAVQPSFSKGKTTLLNHNRRALSKVQ